MSSLKPFSLSEALSGKAVMLRSGAKAHVRYFESKLVVNTDSRVIGYTDGGLLLSWCPEGRYNPELRELHLWDIVGMYPETRIINGFEVPAPETEAPEYGRVYFTPALLGKRFYVGDHWSGNTENEQTLQRGLVFLNKEGAIATAKAMLGINPVEKKNETI